MKKLLLCLAGVSLFTLTGCGSKESYDLKCSGDYTMTMDVCFEDHYYATSDNEEQAAEIARIDLCSDHSNGTGEYRFHLDGDKVLVDFDEVFNEEFTSKYYEEMEEAMEEFNRKSDCTLEKKDNKTYFSCKNYDLTQRLEDYKTKEKLKDLMENTLKYKCE